MKITVVVPFYNTPADAFKNCIIALKNLDPFEVILVDDCSTDKDTLTVASESGYKVIKTEVNSGSDGVPYNLGVLEAKGDYICRCDSDDRLLALPTSMNTDVWMGKIIGKPYPTPLTVESLISYPRNVN